MKKIERDGYFIYYRDENGNELRALEETGRLLGATFDGAEYGNVQQTPLPNPTYKWQRIGKGRMGKAFLDWREQAEKEIKAALEKPISK